jgi:succinate dehydrogenase/fumarate reductase flavoprotein subunit
MGGLCAAVRARELGAKPVVFEKGDRPGGSMLLSSGVVWRFRDLAEFRRECPSGDPRLQRQVIERLDDGIAWLESLGAPVVARGENPQTIFVRFDLRGLTDALVRAAGEPLLRTPVPDDAEAPLVLASGGFQGDRRLVSRYITPEAEHLWLRANPWSEGDGLRMALNRGGALSEGLDEFYGRNLPAPPAEVRPETFVPLAQLYAQEAVVVNDRGEEFVRGPYSWSQIEAVQKTALQPAAQAWYVLDARGLGAVVRDGPVEERVGRAEAAGGTVLRADSLGELAAAMAVPELPAAPKLSEPPFTAVHVRAAITHTIGGVAIDERARVLGKEGAPVAGLYACGADVGGISTGGYASGLAGALVFGRIAAESAAT